FGARDPGARRAVPHHGAGEAGAAGHQRGVTVDGLLYGLVGGGLVTVMAGVALRVLPPYGGMGLPVGCLLTLMGLVGSLLDSVLGATVQATVVDRGSGRVVEGAGGTRVKVVEGGSRVVEGRDWLTNNGVNFVMAFLTSLLAMGSAYVLGLGL
ncbi:protein PGR-like, partial [Teratosphaeria destructans]